jgi:SAM-dependent methyltransferase
MWWQAFFDADYVRLWGGTMPAERTEREADGLWKVLGLSPGARVLDAPCGYGRLSDALARRGAAVLGVDQSAALLAEAERRAELTGETGARFRRHDLRQPLSEGGFDAAINVFSSLGYGSEAEDQAILAHLRQAVRPGGKVFVETMHRDCYAAVAARGGKPAARLADGTLIVEEPRFDPLAGRVETCWYHAGPAGAGEKRASIRLYSITELAALLGRAGLAVSSLHAGCSPAPFVAEGPELGGRVGILATAR